MIIEVKNEEMLGKNNDSLLYTQLITLQKEKQELIEYLKEKISILDNILENEKDEDKIYNCLIRRTTFKEILSKIEKSDK